MSEIPSIPHFFFEISPPSSLATSSCPLFQLSRELRDIIYDHLWSGKEIVQHRRTKTYFRIFYPPCKIADRSPKEEDNRRYLKIFYPNHKIADCPPEEESPTNLPTWLCSSKKIMAEGMQQLYRQAICTEYEDDRSTQSASFKLLSIYHLRRIHFSKRHPVQPGIAVDLEGNGLLRIAREDEHGNLSIDDVPHAYLSFDHSNYDQPTERAVIVPDYETTYDTEYMLPGRRMS